jgi:hypothetical protein
MGDEGHQRAEQTVREMNGAARVLDSSFRTVHLVGRYKRGSFVQIVVSDTLEIRSHATVSGIVGAGSGQAPPPPDPVGPKFVALADTSPPVAEVLAILGTPAPLGWFELYKLYEIVRHEMDPIPAGWTSNADLKAFTASANRHDVSGADARHARSSGQPPRRTMALADARGYIMRLTHQWLASLI